MIRSKVPLPPLKPFKFTYQSSFVNDSALIDKILQKIQLERKYKSDTKILDVYPSNGIFSASIYNRIRPQQHLLMENRKEFNTYLTDYISTLPSDNTFEIHNLDPYSWRSFLDITDKTKVLEPGFQSRKTLHSNFLFTGHVSNEGLLMQWLACIANQNWIQRFGNVKMLLWVPNSSALKIMAYPSGTSRSKCSVLRETFSNTKLIAIPDDKDVEKYDSRLLQKDEPILVNPLGYSSAKLPLALLEIDPVDHDIDTYAWDFVVKQLMTSRTKPLNETLNFLGPAALDFFKTHLSPEFLKRGAASLNAEEFADLVRIFKLWPFKPDSMVDSLDDVKEM